MITKKLKILVFMILSLTLILIFTSCDSSGAPEITKFNVNVNIIDSETEEGIEGAEVSLGDNMALTDSEGIVKFNSIEKAQYKLIVIAEGYETADEGIIVVDADSTVFKIEMIMKNPVIYNITFKEANEIEVVDIDIDGKSIITTDINGEASIDLEDGNYNFSAKKDGYDEYNGSFQVDGAVKIVNFELVDDVITVTTSAGLKEALNKGVSIIIVEGELDLDLDSDTLNVKTLIIKDKVSIISQGKLQGISGNIKGPGILEIDSANVTLKDLTLDARLNLLNYDGVNIQGYVKTNEQVSNRVAGEITIDRDATWILREDYLVARKKTLTLRGEGTIVAEPTGSNGYYGFQEEEGGGSIGTNVIIDGFLTINYVSFKTTRAAFCAIIVDIKEAAVFNNVTFDYKVLGTDSSEFNNCTFTNTDVEVDGAAKFNKTTFKIGDYSWSPDYSIVISAPGSEFNNIELNGMDSSSISAYFSITINEKTLFNEVIALIHDNYVRINVNDTTLNISGDLEGNGNRNIEISSSGINSKVTIDAEVNIQHVTFNAFVENATFDINVNKDVIFDFVTYNSYKGKDGQHVRIIIADGVTLTTSNMSGVVNENYEYTGNGNVIGDHIYTPEL